MKVLLSCDDGLEAEGTAALATEIARLGPVRACAPGRASSGAGHAVTLHEPVSAAPAELAGCECAVAVRGTPADAVKLALAELWPGWAELVVSGINSGPNIGVNVFYSGTCGAAAEGAVWGLSALAVSLDISDPYDFVEAARRARPVLERLAGLVPFPPGLFFNVNLPACADRVRGVRLTRQGTSGFREHYRRLRGRDAGDREPGAHPAREADGARHYRVEGDMHVEDPDESYDAAALAAGYISVTPMCLDLTADPLRAPEAGRKSELEALLGRLADWR